MKKIYLGGLFIIYLLSFNVAAAQVNTTTSLEQEYLRGTVRSITTATEINAGGNPADYQNIVVELTNAASGEKTVTVKERIDIEVISRIQPKVGDKVVVLKTTNAGITDYVITDYDRLPMLALVTIIFVVSVLVLSRWKGLLSLVALGLS